MTRSCLAALPLILGLMGVAHAQVIADQPYRMDSNLRLHTDALVNGKGPFNFQLDTAASITFLFEKARSQLSVTGDASDPYTIYGLSGRTQAARGRADEVRIAGLSVRNLNIGLLPDGDDTPDGVLGIDTLGHTMLVLDRPAMRMKLLSPDSAAAKDYQAWQSAEFSPRNLQGIDAKFWITRAEFGNQGARFAAVVNLGAGITIMNWKAAEQLGIKQTEVRQFNPPDKRLRDLLGTTAPALNTMVTIRLAGHTFANHRVLICNAPVFEFMGLQNVPAAIIGPGLLKDHSLALDFVGQKLHIGPKVQQTASR